MRFYDLQPLWDTHCDYNFVISGRGPGKSTAMVNKLIDEFADHGAEFVRIARYDWETSRTLMNQWFNEVNRERMHEKLGAHPSFESLQWLARSDDDDKYAQVMGHLVTLNNQDTVKSAAYDRVENVVFEEFSLLRERDYMQGEVEAFLSALSTIARRRQNVRVWFIGNTLSKHNPFFDFFGIDIDRMNIKPGEIRRFRCAGFGGHGATVAIQFAEMAEADYMELSPLMRLGGNVTATSGLYEIDPSVSEFDKRTAGLFPASFSKLLPTVAGAYLGGGEFCETLVTKRPRFDDMRLIVLRRIDPTLVRVGKETWLNLSGSFNPEWHIEGLEMSSRTLKCVSPLTLFADEKAMRRFQEMDAKCVHAYETDDMRWRWRNFVDMYGYERGAV